MPVKLRIAKRLRPSFDDTTLDLFVRLDRELHPAIDDEHDLARRLNLVDHYWTINSVLDRSAGPCHPEGYLANTHWHECRAIREALLAAVVSGPREMGLLVEAKAGS
jgi:hypothetical protein